MNAPRVERNFLPQREPIRGKMVHKGTVDATPFTTGTVGRDGGAPRKTLMSRLHVADHAHPGPAIWILALAAMVCIVLAYAYFAHISSYLLAALP